MKCADPFGGGGGAAAVVALLVPAFPGITGRGWSWVAATIRSRSGVGADLLRVARGRGGHDDLAAIALYTSEGFHRAERLAGFYSARRFPNDGEAWRMLRHVSRPEA